MVKALDRSFAVIVEFFVTPDVAWPGDSDEAPFKGFSGNADVADGAASAIGSTAGAAADGAAAFAFADVANDAFVDRFADAFTRASADASTGVTAVAPAENDEALFFSSRVI